MRRKLLFAERMLHGDGITPFNMVVPVKLRGNFTLNSLNTALKKLQEKHPLLNACIEYDSDAMPWFVTNDAHHPIPVNIVKRISDDDWETVSAHEWAKPFDTRTGPLMRVVWIQGEELSEFLLVLHHCFCDGEGVLSILTEMLSLLDDENTDIGPRYPLLNLSELIPPEIFTSKRKIIKSKITGRIATMVLWLIPVRKKAIDREKDYLIHWQVDKALSDSLIATCKARQVTVNTVFCMALLNAFKEVRKQQFHNKISCPVNIRKFAPEIKKDYLFAFGLMFVTSLGKPSDFFSDAKSMQADISKKLSKLKPYETIMMMEEAHASLDNFTNLLKYGKSSNDCMFSNLGKIDIPHQYQSFTVETIYSPSVIGPYGNTTTLVTSTYNGIMDFTFIGSEKYLPYKQAMAIKDNMMVIIATQA